MLDDSVAERYAEAFFSVAGEHEKEDIWKEQLSNIVTTVSKIPFLDKIMKYPFALKSEKRDIFTKVFSSQVDQQVLNFIYLIIDHDRGAYLNLIYEKYAECIRKSRRILLAEITSAKELSSYEQTRLISSISRREGRAVEASFKIDPSLIGGVVVKIEGKIIDGSLKKSLKDLADSFVKADFSAFSDSEELLEDEFLPKEENLSESEEEIEFLPEKENLSESEEEIEFLPEDEVLPKEEISIEEENSKTKLKTVQDEPVKKKKKKKHKKSKQ